MATVHPAATPTKHITPLMIHKASPFAIAEGHVKRALSASGSWGPLREGTPYSVMRRHTVHCDHKNNSLYQFKYRPRQSLKQHSANQDSQCGGMQSYCGTNGCSVRIRRINHRQVDLAFAHPAQSCAVVGIDDLLAICIFLGFFAHKQEWQLPHFSFMVRYGCLPRLHAQTSHKVTHVHTMSGDLKSVLVIALLIQGMYSPWSRDARELTCRDVQTARH